MLRQLLQQWVSAVIVLLIVRKERSPIATSTTNRQRFRLTGKLPQQTLEVTTIVRYVHILHSCQHCTIQLSKAAFPNTLKTLFILPVTLEDLYGGPHNGLAGPQHLKFCPSSPITILRRPTPSSSTTQAVVIDSTPQDIPLPSIESDKLRADTPLTFQQRSRSPRDRDSRRRSRSPNNPSRREYSRSPQRTRSRSQEYRRRDRSRSAGHNGYNQNRAPGPPRTMENKEQMMQSIKDSSQQDRRVYVGNLAYDVKWHSLKDFMRTGRDCSCAQH